MQDWTGRGKGVVAAAALALWGGAGAQEPEAQRDEPGVGFVEVLDLRPKDAPDACDPAATQVRLTVHGMAEGRGLLAAEVYRNDQRGFLNKKGRVRRVRVPAQRGAVTVCMDVAPGTYAVAAYHDEDGDRDLGQKWNKMPKEPFALSGDRELKFGWPDIEPSLFDVPRGGADVDVTLIRP